MSISSFINSPKPVYTVVNTAGSIVLPTGADLETVEVITDATDVLTVSVPAGTYDLQMIAGINPANGADLTVGASFLQLVDITDLTSTVIAQSNSASFSGTGANVILTFNHTQRIVLPPKPAVAGVIPPYLLSMNMLVSQMSAGAATLDGIVNDINMTSRIILRPTF